MNSEDEPELAHRRWLEERMFEAHSIRHGMTRGELLALFEPSLGGMISEGAERFVLKRCPLIWIEVRFEERPAKRQGTPSQKIRAVSELRLSHPAMD